MMTPLQRRRKQITPNQTVCVRHCFLRYRPSDLAVGFGREGGGSADWRVGGGVGMWACHACQWDPSGIPFSVGIVHSCWEVRRGPPAPDLGSCSWAWPAPCLSLLAFLGQPWLHTGRPQKRWRKNCMQCQLPRQWSLNALPVGLLTPHCAGWKMARSLNLTTGLAAIRCVCIYKS